MIAKPRLIARLDIKGPRVVKGICFDGLRVMGEPEELAFKYYEQGADELLYIDTVASLYGRNNLSDVVRKAAARIFIPMTVGGGIRSVDDARDLLRSGADKVAVNTAAVKRPELISEIASILGSQAVVVSLQIKKTTDGRWEVYIDNGRQQTGLDALEWAREAERLGAGELLATSVDRDGTGRGLEIEFIRQLMGAVSIPVIAGGGVGKPGDIAEIVQKTHVDAVAIGSILHYQRTTMREIKQILRDAGVAIARHG